MTTRRLVLAGTAVALALVAIVVLSRPTRDAYDRPSLDPRGTGPAGTAALVDLLRSEGARVNLGGLARDRDDVVIQLQDTLGGEPADDLRAWVRDGGTLVVTDPSAALAPARATGASEPVTRPGAGCELLALGDLGPVEPGLPAEFADDPATSSCFTGTSTSGEGVAAVDVRRVGAGLVVALSTPLPLTNEALDRGDNALLAVALVTPSDGTRVRILDPNRFYTDAADVGDGTVLGALPPRGSQAVSQLVVAFFAWALISGRRLGRPVVEELPVPLPASDLVLASGRLLDRNGDVADAAERLRRRARRDLGIGLGLGADPPPQDLAHALTAHGGADPAIVHAALLSPVADQATLVATASHIDRLRRDLHR
ncbi:MAG: DUF4350 domain-containing protein [Iamia sp.]